MLGCAKEDSEILQRTESIHQLNLFNVTNIFIILLSFDGNCEIYLFYFKLARYLSHALLTVCTFLVTSQRYVTIKLIGHVVVRPEENIVISQEVISPRATLFWRKTIMLKPLEGSSNSLMQQNNPTP